MNWTILGISPTKDKAAITAAYRARLPHVNPEDKPEDFKALRAAYEQAIKLADTEETPPARDESPVGLWTEQLQALYGDFAARLDPARWQQLLAADVCYGLDTRPLAEEALLRFLMERYYLPQAVWQLLDETFHWVERRAELYETYPRDFIDYAVVNGVRGPEGLPLALFTPGRDGAVCDEYRRLYFHTDQSDPAALVALTEQLAALPEHHPYGELLRYRLLLDSDPQQALAGYQKLADAYPGDPRLQLEWAARCYQQQDYPAAEQYARRALALRPAGIAARELLADCLAAQNQYEDAKKELFDLMDAAGGDQKRAAQLQEKVQQWNLALIEQWQAQLQTAPDDALRSKLGWSLLQNDRSEEALAQCRQMSDAYADRYDYHNLHASVLYDLRRYEEVLPHLETVLAMLRTMQPDGTKKTDDRISTLPQKLQLLGACYLALSRTEQAMQTLEQALALAPDEPAVLTNMGRVLAQQGQNERALELFTRLVNAMPGSYHGYYLMAQTLFDLGRDRDAFDAVNRALELDGGDLGVYLLKMRILLRNGVWDEVRATLTFLHEHGVTDEIHTVWCEAQLREQGENQKEEALALYQAIADRIEAGEAMNEAAKVYFRILVLEGVNLDARKAEDRDKMLALADKGLAHDPDDAGCLDYKAWLLRKGGRFEEALAIYHRLEAMPRYAKGAWQDLAATYYEDLDKWADQSLHYYELLLEQEEQPDDHFYAGTCCRYLHRFAEGEQHFLRLQEMNPADIDGYNGLAYLYDWMGRHEASLAQIDKVIEMVADREGDQSRFYNHKIRILRRLNRPHEAAAVVDQATEKFGRTNAFRDKFDIYCQFGLWQDAKAVLQRWRRSGQNKPQLAAAEIDLALFSGEDKKARALYVCTKYKLSETDAERLKLLVAELGGLEKTQMHIWEKRAKNRTDQTHVLMNMAQVQWWAGHIENAQAYAARALTQLEEIIPKNRGQEALYRGRRSIVLAILGRMDEARAELAAVRALPLCESCDYCSCKDADIFEANFEEIAGNTSRALALHRAGRQRWPDDMDFAAGILRMERKGAANV